MKKKKWWTIYDSQNDEDLKHVRTTDIERIKRGLKFLNEGQQRYLPKILKDEHENS